MMTENNRFAIVTGGISGIGKSIVSHLSKKYRIFVIDKDKPQLKGKAEYFQADIFLIEGFKKEKKE